MTYQEAAMKYAKYGKVTEYPFLALAEEAGEVMGKLAKYTRKEGIRVGFAVTKAHTPANSVDKQLQTDLVSELGDVMWQLAACCTELGITLEQLQASNLDKLHDRMLRGTIVGSGDNR